MGRARRWDVLTLLVRQDLRFRVPVGNANFCLRRKEERQRELSGIQGVSIADDVGKLYRYFDPR